jgi:hypothetical protein
MNFCERRIPSEVLPIGVIDVISENFRVSELRMLLLGQGLVVARFYAPTLTELQSRSIP